MSDEIDKYSEAHEARVGAERMNLGLACMPHKIFGDIQRIKQLIQERDEARKQLLIAVGLLSTHPQFADKHLEDVLAFIKEASK